MKKRIAFISVIGLIGLLVGCEKNEDPSKEVKKIEMIQSSNETSSVSSSSDKTVWNEHKINQKETFDEMEFVIESVSFTTNARQKDKTGTNVIPAIEIKWKIKNNSKTKTYTTYPDQAQLTSSLGDVLFKADKKSGDTLGGTIEKKQSKKGTLTWYTANQQIEKAKWIELKWMSSYDNPATKTDNEKRKAHRIRIPLK